MLRLLTSRRLTLNIWAGTCVWVQKLGGRDVCRLSTVVDVGNTWRKGRWKWINVLDFHLVIFISGLLILFLTLTWICWMRWILKAGFSSFELENASLLIAFNEVSHSHILFVARDGFVAFLDLRKFDDILEWSEVVRLNSLPLKISQFIELQMLFNLFVVIENWPVVIKHRYAFCEGVKDF